MTRDFKRCCRDFSSCMHHTQAAGRKNKTHSHGSDACGESGYSKASPVHAGRHESSSALRQPGYVGKCFCSNYSLVLGRSEAGQRKGCVSECEWRGEVAEIKPEKVTSAQLSSLAISDCLPMHVSHKRLDFSSLVFSVEMFGQECHLACSQLKKVRWLVWLTDRMVPVTVAEQSHGGEARVGGRERREESTDGSDIAKWCACL